MQVVKRVNGFHLKPYHPVTDSITEDDNLPSEKCMDDYPPTDECLDDKPLPPDNLSEISDNDSIPPPLVFDCTSNSNAQLYSQKTCNKSSTLAETFNVECCSYKTMWQLSASNPAKDSIDDFNVPVLKTYFSSDKVSLY